MTEHEHIGNELWCGQTEQWELRQGGTMWKKAAMTGEVSIPELEMLHSNWTQVIYFHLYKFPKPSAPKGMIIKYFKEQIHSSCCWHQYYFCYHKILTWMSVLCQIPAQLQGQFIVKKFRAIPEAKIMLPLLCLSMHHIIWFKMEMALCCTLILSLHESI